MGGSLARALRGLARPPEVVGWSPDAGEVRAAMAARALDQDAPDPEAAARAADLVVLAAPLGACIDLVARLAPELPPATILTDVASLKAPMARAARAAALEDRWIGSHPMCGSADSGFAASRADLYHDARVWLCAHEAAGPHLPALRRFWVSVGGVTAPMDPDGHDALMARVSHLPQLVANALASVLADAGVDPADLGPGARDMTRLAGSSPDVWRDLLAAAPEELPRRLRDAARAVEELAELLDAGDVDAVARRMAETRAWRRGP
jgi:prephenate dehydrogenase